MKVPGLGFNAALGNAMVVAGSAITPRQPYIIHILTEPLRKLLCGHFDARELQTGARPFGTNRNVKTSACCTVTKPYGVNSKP